MSEYVQETPDYDSDSCGYSAGKTTRSKDGSAGDRSGQRKRWRKRNKTRWVQYMRTYMKKRRALLREGQES